MLIYIILLVFGGFLLISPYRTTRAFSDIRDKMLGIKTPDEELRRGQSFLRLLGLVLAIYGIVKMV